MSGMQRDIIERLSRGRRPFEIAKDLELGLSTVNTHLRRLREKLGVRTNVEAALRWHERKDAAELEYASWGRR